jgi:hypothetical protein
LPRGNECTRRSGYFVIRMPHGVAQASSAKSEFSSSTMDVF